MAIYAEDNAPGQSLPEFAPDITGDERKFEDLIKDGWDVKFAITACKGGDIVGLAIKFTEGSEENIYKWISLTAEAIHRHLDNKTRIAAEVKGQD